MNRGFTLIELMVVVVIIGILAVVAVPKYFGMIAQSKATEVVNAAGAYASAQTSHYMGNGVFGTFREIGYIAPSGNALFGYTDLVAAGYDSTASVHPLWKAESKVALGDCPAGSVWTLSGSGNGDSTATWNIELSGENVAACRGLTHDLGRLDSDGSLAN